MTRKGEGRSAYLIKKPQPQNPDPGSKSVPARHKDVQQPQQSHASAAAAAAQPGSAQDEPSAIFSKSEMCKRF